jgi:CHAT domain-containing protein/predicted negative regulator of RcsB-dependent stress response
MRRLTIAALSALVLLCTPFSDRQSYGLYSIPWTPFMIDLSRVGSPVVASPRPVAVPAQVSAGEGGATPGAQESISLEPGKPIERELSGGQSHSYKITTISGQYLHIVVEQRGIDVAVALFTPDGKKIGEADGEQATVGSETIFAIAEAAGAYRIEARSPDKTAKTGHYEIKIEELREAAAEDNYRVAAESVFLEAEKLRQGTVEEKRKSIEKYHEALELYRRAEDRSRETYIVNKIGWAHLLMGEVQKALDEFNKALQISRAAGDRREESNALNGVGTVYWQMGEMRKTLEKYNEALQISRATGDRRREAAFLNNIGLIHWILGETQKAWEKYNEALPISRAVGDRSREANILGNIGMAYESMGETRKALEKYNEALPLNQTLDDRNGQAAVLNLIGGIYRSMGETRKALEKYNEALPLSQAAGNRNAEARILSNIGEVHQSLGETRKALEKYNEALPLSRAGAERRYEAEALNGIGKVYLSLGETQKALDKFNEALALWRAAGDRNGEAAALLAIARVEQTRGALTQAHQTIEHAVGIVESLRAGIREEHRASYLASRREYYESYIDILAEQHRQNQIAGFDAAAFAVSERARARSLLELLTESLADIRQGVDSSLLERERSLQRLLNAKAAAQFALLNRKHTPAQAEAASKEIDSITAEYEELRAQIRARNPRYAALTQPQPLSLAEIQQQVLDPDTLFLEYSLGDNGSHLFVVSQTSITWRRLPKRAEIEEATRRLRELLTAPQPQPGDTEPKYQARVKMAGKRYWLQAAELSRMLLAPVASQLGKKRLAIVADGALQYIPFAALPVPSPGNDKGRDSGAEPQPLFVEHEIVSLPSASTLATLRRETAGRKPAEKSLAVLADPVFTDDDTRVSRDVSKAGAEEKTRSADSDETDIGFLQMTRSGRETGVIGAEGGFGRLLSTRREAAAILALVPERERMQALDFEASRATALRPELGEYRIVHFATHGMLNNTHPELSGIVLSLVNKEGHQQDGFLRLQDVYNLKLPAELVVLSACQTGLGKEIKGEGLIGLTRGFMYAGAPRVVASLWKVDDRATSELMKRFYQCVLGPEALSPAGALRQAQLSIWKEKQWREPYYWAAFVLQGEWK